MGYIVRAKCDNCGYEGLIEIKDGEKVSHTECPICKCRELTRATFAQPSRIHDKEATIK